jgi:hypothetical protein
MSVALLRIEVGVDSRIDTAVSDCIHFSLALLDMFILNG